MSLEDVVRFFCRFISEFFRLILFFASILFMLLSIGLLLLSFDTQYIYQTIGIKQSAAYFLVIIALAVYLIALSIIGLHGTFFRSESSMECFSLLASMNVLIGLGVFMYISPRLNDSSSEVAHSLQNLQVNYDWFNKSDSSEQVRDATTKWDIVQHSGECCGVQAPADWLQFRPAEVRTNDLPISCCQNMTEALLQGRVCPAGSVSWEQGCLDVIKNANSGVSVLILALILMNLVLSSMGCLVIFCKPSRKRETYIDFN